MTITHGSGNVFADVGASDPEVKLIKAQLALALDQTIRARDWTQTEAAERAGLTQADISRLRRGEVMGFTIDRLMRSLIALGYRVEVALTVATEPVAHPTARVA